MRLAGTWTIQVLSAGDGRPLGDVSRIPGSGPMARAVTQRPSNIAHQPLDVGLGAGSRVGVGDTVGLGLALVGLDTAKGCVPGGRACGHPPVQIELFGPSYP